MRDACPSLQENLTAFGPIRPLWLCLGQYCLFPLPAALWRFNKLHDSFPSLSTCGPLAKRYPGLNLPLFSYGFNLLLN